jgi:hypothetical protein
LTLVNTLDRQLRILSRAARERLRIDDLRIRVSKSWRLLGMAGEPPLHEVTNQAGAARVLVAAGAARDDLCDALGISSNLGANYVSRARSTRPSARRGMTRTAP